MAFEPNSSAGLRRELEQAEVNLNHFLAERQRVADEVARWEQVVGNLKKTIEMYDSPATSVRRVPEKPAVNRTRVRWAQQWAGALSTWKMTHGQNPTKRELIREIGAHFHVHEATANAAVNGAIRRGELLLKMDRCYVPESKTLQAVS